jgi:hypothetical protein
MEKLKEERSKLEVRKELRHGVQGKELIKPQMTEITEIFNAVIYENCEICI